jgi:carbonic anhydrase/acetyltransferase-like protein (isoleucine patch superfamily)
LRKLGKMAHPKVLSPYFLGALTEDQMTAMQTIGDFYVAGSAVVTGDVVIGPGANLWFGVVVRGDLARITLGAGVNLQDGVIVHTDTDAPQDLGEGVVVGHGAILHGRRIGADTLVGMGATLLSGSDIGPECLIAAGALVPEGRRIPPRSVVMGVPGQVVRALTDEDLERTRRICAHYQEMARRYASGEFSPPWNKSLT